MIIPLVDPSKIKVPPHEGDFLPWGAVFLILMVIGIFIFDWYRNKNEKEN